MTKKGIVDPWKKIDPLKPQPPKREAVEKKDLEDLNLDADLTIPGRYILRTKHVSISIISVHVTTPQTALDLLAGCISALWMNKNISEHLKEADIGVKTKNMMYNAPIGGAQASTWASDNSTIWFINKSLDVGAKALAEILNLPEALPTVKKFGITTMITA